MFDESDFAETFVEEFFAKQPAEKWVLRCDDGSSAKPVKNKKRPLAAFDHPSAIASAQQPKSLELPTTTWHVLGSYLDPHDIANLCQVCQATSEALGLGLAGFPENDCSISGDDNLVAATEGTATILTPNIKVRLQSIFRYFRILNIYVERLQVLQYSWIEICRIFTELAFRLQNVYGIEWEVHPLHRALASERVLEFLCNFYGDPEAEAMRVPWQEGYGLEPLLFRNYKVCQKCTRLHLGLLEDVEEEGEHVVSLDGKSRWAWRMEEEELPEWLKVAANNIDDFTSTAQKAIQKGQLPVIWVFSPTDGDCEDEHGMFPKENLQTRTISWCPFHHLEIKADWGKKNEFQDVIDSDEDEYSNVQGLVHHFLRYAGGYSQQSVGPGATFFRLAWLHAHRIPPFDIVDACIDWAQGITATTEDDESDLGTPIPFQEIISNVQALAVDKTVHVATIDNVYIC